MSTRPDLVISVIASRYWLLVFEFIGTARWAGGCCAKAHITVLGIRNDEILGRIFSGMDAGELAVEGFGHLNSNYIFSVL